MSPERHQRIREKLHFRQMDLTILLEEVNKPYNVSAVMRTCDSVGIHQVHAVWHTQDEVRTVTAKGAQAWVGMQTHATITDAVAQVKQQDMQVLVTHLSDEAVDFRQVDYTRPTAIIMGQEKHGATDSAIALADQAIMIPMLGMAQSLNVSVAAAVILYEAQRQRELAGLYTHSTLSESEYQRLLFSRGYPKIYQQWQGKELPYPHINQHGEIDADAHWWQQLRGKG